MTPMVLLLKQWKSRSSPGLPDPEVTHGKPFTLIIMSTGKYPNAFIAGWSSPVARQAHNLKVVSSNLAPASKNKPPLVGGFLLLTAAKPPIHL